MLSKGVRLQVVPVRDYKVELKDFDALIDHRTRLVAVSLVSLTTGLAVRSRQSEPGLVDVLSS